MRVSDRTALPLLFLDIDGPLLPIGGDPRPRPPIPDPEWHFAGLKRAAGLALSALPCVLVWATAWEEEANTEIATRIGLPPLPRVAWSRSTDERQYREDRRIGLHWKTRNLVDWAAGRPFAWIDDEITDADRHWVSANHPGHALLHLVDAVRGLDDADLVAIGDWLRTVWNQQP